MGVNIFHDALSFNTKEGGGNGGLSIHANGAEGGMTEVGSWTFTGSDNLRQDLDIGIKFPVRNFMIYTYADTDTKFVYNSTKKFACGIYFCPGEIIQFIETPNPTPIGDNIARQWVKALACDWKYTSGGTYPMYGTPYLSCNAMVSGDNFDSAATGGAVKFNVYENDTSKVKLSLAASPTSSNGKFYSGIKYNCKLYYFGSDPANDFVTI